MDHLEIANRVAEEKLRAQMELVRELYTSEGFHRYWFSQLGTQKFKTNTECFDYVNDLHETLFGQPKFSSYNTFNNWRWRHNKQNNE